MLPSVRIISKTESAEQILSYCARVSNPSNQENYDTAPKLIKYLIRNKHWSPLEMVNVVMEIETTRDIARQILRHRSFSFQEFSQRYANPNELGYAIREARLQHPTNRQSSLPNTDQALEEEWSSYQSKMMGLAQDYYEWAMEEGIAKEVARAILPEGLVKSRLYMNGNLRSWVHYCGLRCGNGTQEEHQKVAKLAWKELKETFPWLEDGMIEVEV